MSLLNLLDQLKQRNVTLRAENGQLRIQAPQGVFTPELRAQIGQYKDEILTYLQSEGRGATKLPPMMPNPKERYEPFPLTDIQHAYWIGQMVGLALENAYHFYQEIDSRHLDVERLNRAWQRLIDRHDTLRAVVLSTGQQQILAETPPYLIAIHDLTDLPPAAIEEQLLATREEMGHQVLSLSEWPLFDLRVTRLDAEHSRIHISIAMIMMDGGSLQRLMGEWNAFYENPDLLLPLLELSYRDYVVWNKGLEATPHYQQAQNYWLQRLDTLPPAPKLPLRRTAINLNGQDQSRESEAKFVHRHLFIEAAHWQVLQQRAQQVGITPTALLAAAFSEVLTLWSEQPQFTLNCTFFNRPTELHPQLDDILGDFTAATLLEVDNRGGGTLVDRAKQLHRRLWQDLENRAFNGVRVIQALTSRQKHQVGPLMPIVFTSMLGVKSAASPREDGAFLDGTVVYNITQTPQVSLDYQVNEIAGGLSIVWDAVDSYYPDGVIADLFAAHTKLLYWLVEEEQWWMSTPEQSPAPVSAQLRSTLLPSAQLAQLTTINDTTGDYPEVLLHTLFSRHAQAQPAAVALITSQRSLTYGELHQRAQAVACWLQQKNGGHPLPADTLVAIVMEKGWEQIVGVFGTLMAGAAYVPVDPALPTARQQYILEQGAVRFVLTQAQLVETNVWPAQIPPDHRLAVDLDEGGPGVPLVSNDNTPASLAYVLYTSGSTGVPKGVMIEHRSVVNRMSDIADRFGLRATDRAIALTALHHDLSVFDIFGMLSVVGGTLVIPDAYLIRDPQHWVALMTTHGVTLWNSVPAFMQMLVEHLEQSSPAAALPPALRWVIFSGDFIPVTLPDRLRTLQPQIELIASGGPTETTVWDIYYRIEAVDPTWPSIPYGKPLKNAHYYVMDEHLQLRPVWVPGELCIGGVGLARGYWQDAEKSAAKFVIHPLTGERLYRSGDLGRFLPDGNIEILGRTDFQIKIRGQRIELGEIEACLRQHPLIKEAVVNPVDDAYGRRQLAAYVVLADPAERVPAESTGAAAQASAAADFAQMPGVTITDPVERLVFKLGKPNLRRFPSSNRNGATASQLPASVLALPQPFQGDTFQAHYLLRQSYRQFKAEAISATIFSQLLASLLAVHLAEAPLPKYRYPSAGGLYPVQTYLYVKEGRVEGVEQGYYYYQPLEHQLILLSTEGQGAAWLYPGTNGAIFDQAAFALFLVAEMAAITPMYGDVARDFALLEAGYMSQLLMMEATQLQLGFCAIGGLTNPVLEAALALGPSQQILHSLVGGQIEPVQTTRWLQPAEPGYSAPVAATTWQTRLATALADQLPEHMVPTLYVALDKLPLTGNGKVDRKALAEMQVDLPVETFEAPGNDLEVQISAILQEIGGLDRVSVTQNFADLGLNSVHMVTINNQLKERLQREIPIAVLFEYTTIRELSQYLTQAGDDRGELSQASASRIDAQSATQSRRAERAQARLSSRQRRRTSIPDPQSPVPNEQ